MRDHYWHAGNWIEWLGGVRTLPGHGINLTMRTNSRTTPGTPETSSTPLISNPLTWLLGAVALLMLLGGCAPSSKVRYEKLVYGAADPQPATNNIVALAFGLDDNGHRTALAMADASE